MHFLTSIDGFKDRIQAEAVPDSEAFEAEVKLPSTVTSFEYKTFVNGNPVTLGVRNTSFGQNNVCFVPVSVC